MAAAYRAFIPADTPYLLTFGRPVDASMEPIGPSSFGRVFDSGMASAGLQTQGGQVT